MSIRFGIALSFCFVAAAHAAQSSSTIMGGEGYVEVEGQGASASATLPNGDTLVVRDGDVFIDGEKVPENVARFVAKSKDVYAIERAGSHITVHRE